MNNFIEELRDENSQPLGAKLIMIKSERENVRSSEGLLIGAKNEMIFNRPSILKSQDKDPRIGTECSLPSTNSESTRGTSTVLR